MHKTCDSCGQPFEAKRAAAKYCGERCKKRAQRQPKAPDSEVSPRAAEVTADALAVATRTELEAAGRLASATGQAALVLARRIDSCEAETGSSLAALVREHRATLGEALQAAEGKADPLDELRVRRERKLASG